MAKALSSDPIYRSLVEARVKLLFDFPFFGNLASRMKLIDATKWCPTAATDGRNFYYNREFIRKLTKEQLLFLMGHEVLHAVYDHLGRRAGRDPQIWNMANDYIVNFTLVKERIGEMIKGGLYSDKYTDELTSDEVYNLLQKNSVQIQMPLDVHLELGGDGDDDNDGKNSGDGNGNGGGKTATVTVVGEDGPPSLSEEDLAKIRNEMKAAVINAAQACAGKVPAGVKRLIEDITEPKMDWRTMLECHIQSAIKDDFTWRRISKKSWGCGAILPGQNTMETIDIAICIDCSGSISDQMLKDFLGEVKGIMEQYVDFKIRLWTFDTRVYNEQMFTPENLDEIYEYDIQGGGGTMFECNWEHMRENDIEPHKLVMFTDGYPGGSWGEEDYCDTLFIVHGNTSIVAPFGMTAYYDEEV